MIRLLVADDQDLIRAGLRALLARTEDIEVVGDVPDGLAAVEQARVLVPDVVLMDIRMPGIDGIEATRRIVADPALGAVRVLVLTTFDTDAHVFDALRAGAAGFLMKDARPEELRAAVRTVADGGALLAPAVTRRVVAAAVAGGSTPDPDDHPASSTLTEREREVLTLIGKGLDNAHIADRLVISPATARTYVSRLLAKTHARDRAQLVVLAYESGLVRPGG
ncbi:response regulator transcription factor [Occultella gossypii]|uniref:Response regulator transcription factor n=1 Tax=Occultella gossypii TaxID=2800820 RepID=A0ABS7S3N6_9MICO|nr:response regulator transcription factor [Occultella gossypii]MBZ2194943.1 response regulator transcription factor [Occultella gossypii]